MVNVYDGQMDIYKMGTGDKTIVLLPGLGVAKVQQATGLTSVLAPLTTSKFKLMALGHTEKEVNDLIVFAGFSINNNVPDQMRRTIGCIKVTNETDYPLSVPFYKIISRQTYANLRNKKQSD